MDFLQIDEDLKVGEVVGVINATDLDSSGIDSLTQLKDRY